METINLTGLSYQEIEVDEIIVGSDFTVDMEVENEHHYILDNGIIAHNTISFLMDQQDSTGVEPLYSPEAIKKLAGGGTMTIIPTVIVEYLTGKAELSDIQKADIMKNGLEGLDFELLPDKVNEVLCFAGSSSYNNRVIAPEDHVKMVGAIQQFVSGGISKTINLPYEATMMDIAKSYLMAYELGIKSIIVYRDNSKGTQVLNSKQDKLEERVVLSPAKPPDNLSHETIVSAVKKVSDERKLSASPILFKTEDLVKSKLEHIFDEAHEGRVNLEYEVFREKIKGPVIDLIMKYRPLTIEDSWKKGDEERRGDGGRVTTMPEERRGSTFEIGIIFPGGKHNLFIHTGEYEGSLAEIYIDGFPEGSCIRGLLNGFSIAFSFCLQWGVPLEKLVAKFLNDRFEPNGLTTSQDPRLRFTSSILDLVVKVLDIKYLGGSVSELGDENMSVTVKDIEIPIKKRNQSTGDLCEHCNGIMRPDGRCRKCSACGRSNGGCG